MSALTYLTKERYMSLVKQYEGGHWTPDTIDQRWEYHSRVVELVKSLNINSPSQVLEMGTMGISCVDNSDTLDYLERWNFPEKKPTHVHDARMTPWPLNDKQYEVFIALRVFQHLTPFQKEATREAMRIARKVIIAVPDTYRNKELKDSKGITYADFVDFLDGIHPNLYFPTQVEYVYYWDVENPSRINLETVMQRTFSDGRRPATPNSPKQDQIGLILEKSKRVTKTLAGKGLSIFRKTILQVTGGRSDSVNGYNQVAPRRASHHLEFLGPSGVGKSTLLNEVKKFAIGNWAYKENLPDVLSLLIDDQSNGTQHLQLFQKKIQNLDKYNLGSYQKLRLVRYFSDVLLKDLAMDNSDWSSKRFMLDDELCQNFSEELIELSDSELGRLVKNRALVFVQTGNSNTTVNRIRRRERETGRTVAYHVGLNDDELKDHVESNSSLFKAFINRVEALGVPVCKIFAEDDLQMNIKNVLDFEKQFIELS